MKRLKIQYKIFLIIIALVLLITLSIKSYQAYRIKHAKIEVSLITNLDIEVYSEVKLKDLITSINGELINNKTINTNELGKQTISFEYINDDNIKVPYSFDIEVVDNTPPLISKYRYLTITEGDKDFSKNIFCGDNYDDNPKCMLKGDYDINTPGVYEVEFIGKDSSNNESTTPITLTVKKKVKSTAKSTNTNFKLVGTDFSDIVDEYKTKKTKIGIDVSHWQGDINYKKVKKAGVEFAFIRLGSQKGRGGKYQLDTKFKENIEGFQKEGIPVGVYFFSYADSKEEAKKQAKWVVKQLKDYDIDLEVVFDWENWASYQDYLLSFKHLNDVATTFNKTIEANGYNSMLYSSKNYLETIWQANNYNVWLAHYTKKTNYEGDYKYWQICEDGVVDGIKDNNVDIDIMYK